MHDGGDVAVGGDLICAGLEVVCVEGDPGHVWLPGRADDCAGLGGGDVVHGVGFVGDEEQHVFGEADGGVVGGRDEAAIDVSGGQLS